MKLLLDLLGFLQPYGTYSYFFIFGVLVACGFGLPLPEDITLVTSGILASRAIIEFPFAILVCLVGVLFGDGLIFYMGSHYGLKLRNSKFFALVLPEKRDAAVKSIFAKYGDRVIFMARFMPGLRTPLFFATGSYHVPFWKFFVLDGLAAMISVPLWVYVGFLFGSNIEELEVVMRKAQVGIYATLGTILVLGVGGYFVRRRFFSTPEVKKIPQ